MPSWRSGLPFAMSLATGPLSLRKRFPMSLKFPAAWTFLLALGCHDIQVQPLPPDLSPSVDLAPPAPKCAAAKGLTGDTLLCVDFKDLATQVLGATNPAPIDAWNFDKADKGCWEINGGKLQVKNFGSFVGTCSFSMPLTDLSSSTNQKYQSVTLAVWQRVDVDQNALPPQTAKLILGQDLALREFTTLTGKNPRQQNQYTLMRSGLAAVPGVGTNFQPLFKLSSGAVYAGIGWQIESIAVMGNP